ncbi:MAG: ABC transporter permease [Thomasclavelia sp.]|nr:ABC transporter permease [Thomasclavelia sp.]
MNIFKLAFRNIKKSIKDYSIYFLTLLIAVCIFYIFNSLDSQTAMLNISKSNKETVQLLVKLLGGLSVFVAIVIGFLIVYANNYIVKRRSKEIGLYMMLGMPKYRISLILLVETLMVGVLSLFIGIQLSQLISVLVAKLFAANMSSFTFVFSFNAFMMTIKIFSIIFLLVMVLNVISLSKVKVINILNREKKNQSIKVKNKYLNALIFVVSLVLIGYAYYLVFDKVLITSITKSMIMLVCGAVGTLLFFYSVSGFILKVVQKCKRIYYKDLNMFILRQMNNKINTHVLSMTVISLLLLLSMGILSTSLSLADAANSSILESNPTDSVITETYGGSGIKDYKNTDFYKDSLKEECEYLTYNSDKITTTSLLLKKDIKEINNGDMTYVSDAKMDIMLESDYNKVAKLLGDKTINLQKDKYKFVGNWEYSNKYYGRFLKEDGKITIGDKTLNYQGGKILDTNVNGTGYVYGVVVVPDSYKDVMTPSTTYLLTNTNHDLTEKEYTKAEKFLSRYDTVQLPTFQTEVLDASIGVSAIFIFIGLYLGFIFAISSCTILAIEQLSESTDNIHRYDTLRRVGASEGLLKKALFIQTMLAFILPLIVGVIHTIVGVTAINDILSLIFNGLSLNGVGYTIAFMIIVYGGYCFVTYLASSRILKKH